MRVRLTYSGALNPCGTTNFGEVEDYTINVQGWLDITPMYDTVVPGDTSFVAIDFKSIDLPEGNYSTNLVINSNDPENENIQIPILLKVSHITVSASASETEVCAETLVRLQADIDGLFDSIHYQWSSNPPGFVSEKARPYVIPLVSTWYIVKAQDGEYLAYDSIFVTAFPLPQINFGSDTTICGSTTLTLDAGDDGISYLWSTGDTVNTITIDSTGVGFDAKIISVEVVDSNGCTNTQEIDIQFINCTGIDNNQENSFSIYPNPTDDIIYIEMDNPMNKCYNLRIINIWGITVYQMQNIKLVNTDPQRISLVDIEPGIYSVLIESGNSVFQKKLVISH